MSTSLAFDCVSERLCEWTSLDALSARGTVRILLRDAGLDAASVTLQQMAAVATQLLPAALRSRGVDDSDAVSARIAEALASLRDDQDAQETPDQVFARLGSSG